MFAAGLHYWQLGDGQYWGHNAIIRVAPFMEHCALPRLPGRAAARRRHPQPRLRRSRADGARRLVALARLRPAGQLRGDAVVAARGDEARPPLVSGQPPAPAAALHRGPLRRPPRAVPERRARPTSRRCSGSASCCSQHRRGASGRRCASPIYFPDGRSLFPEWPVWRPDWALALAAVTGRDPVPAEDPRDPAGACVRGEAKLVRRRRAAARERAARDRAVEPVRADPHGLPHPLRADEPDRPHGLLALAGARRRRDELARGDPPPRRRHDRRVRLGGRRVLAEPDLLLVAHADRVRADPLGPALGLVEPRRARRSRARARALPHARGERAAARARRRGRATSPRPSTRGDAAAVASRRFRARRRRSRSSTRCTAR